MRWSTIAHTTMMEAMWKPTLPFTQCFDFNSRAVSRPDLFTLPLTHTADKAGSPECTGRGWGHDTAPRKTLEVKDAQWSLWQPN